MKTLAIIGASALALAGCAANGSLATSPGQISIATTTAAVCTGLATAQVTPLGLSSKQQGIVNAGVAACSATSEGTNMTSATAAPAIFAAAAVLVQAGYKL
jgi:hypothetical protein